MNNRKYSLILSKSKDIFVLVFLLIRLRLRHFKLVICITRLKTVILQVRARFVGAEASAEAPQVQENILLVLHKNTVRAILLVVHIHKKHKEKVLQKYLSKKQEIRISSFGLGYSLVFRSAVVSDDFTVWSFASSCINYVYGNEQDEYLLLVFLHYSELFRVNLKNFQPKLDFLLI
jgi:hypothetical protein